MGRWTEALVVFVPCLVELVCTIFLVFLGCGSTLNWPQEETSPTVLTISLSFGFLYAFLGNISTLVSGGFFNPAITAALATIKTIPIKRAVCLIFAQLTGGEIDSLLATRAPRMSTFDFCKKLQIAIFFFGFLKSTSSFFAV